MHKIPTCMTYAFDAILLPAYAGAVRDVDVGLAALGGLAGGDEADLHAIVMQGAPSSEGQDPFIEREERQYERTKERLRRYGLPKGTVQERETWSIRMHYLKKKRHRIEAKRADRKAFREFQPSSKSRLRLSGVGGQAKRKQLQDNVGVLATVAEVETQNNHFDATKHLESAFSYGNTNVVSRWEDVQSSQVRLSRAFISALFFQRQFALLQLLLQVSLSQNPLFVLVSNKWDETGHRLTLGSDPSDKSSHVEVLVFCIDILILWTGVSFFFTFILPPIAIPSCSAAHIWSALHAFKYAEAFQNWKQEMRTLTTILFVDLHERDDASGNIKYCNFIFVREELDPGIGFEGLRCSLHQNNLIQEGVCLMRGPVSYKRSQDSCRSYSHRWCLRPHV